MGTRLRIFFIGDDDSMHRIPMARYQRLINREPAGRFPEYPGKRVRCATVAVEVVDRTPVAILYLGYSIISFDNHGHIDAARNEKEMQLAREFAPTLIEEEQPSQVIDAKVRFFKRQYAHQFKWVPSRELEGAIIEAVLPSDS